MGKVFLTIMPCPLPAEFQDITDPCPVVTRELRHIHPPKHLFTELIAYNYDWEIDLSKASPKQFVYWYHEHILRQCERAFKKGAIVLLAGFPLTKENYVDEILRYVLEIRDLPVILDESKELLSLGHANVDLEHVWDGESIDALPVADRYP